MADIELVIKIPEYMFEDIQDRCRHPNKGNGINLLEYAVAKGISLPKGHGRLIDADAIQVIELEDSLNFMQHIKGDEVNVYIDAPTVIEADKEQEDGND